MPSTKTETHGVPAATSVRPTCRAVPDEVARAAKRQVCRRRRCPRRGMLRIGWPRQTRGHQGTQAFGERPAESESLLRRVHGVPLAKQKDDDGRAVGVRSLRGEADHLRDGAVPRSDTATGICPADDDPRAAGRPASQSAVHQSAFLRSGRLASTVRERSNAKVRVVRRQSRRRGGGRTAAEAIVQGCCGRWHAGDPFASASGPQCGPRCWCGQMNARNWRADRRDVVGEERVPRRHLVKRLTADVASESGLLGGSPMTQPPRIFGPVSPSVRRW